MKTISYEQFLNVLSALDEYTNCVYEKRDLIKIIFNHYIKEGPFYIYNSFGTKGYYNLRNQRRDFIHFITLIKKTKNEYQY